MAFASTMCAVAAAPAALWTSLPVEPGEAVMVYGGPWADVSAVALSGPDERSVKPLRVTEDCVTFVYPADWPRSAFNARIESATGAVTVRVNAPEVWWQQGDRGKEASPGGWLRVFGRSIYYGDTATVELRGARTVKLQPTSGDLYAMQVALPLDLPLGDYDVMVANGLDATPVNAGKVTIISGAEPWPETVFNIADYGAIANDRLDDTPAIRAALQALIDNGGGVLYVPRGRFGIIGELELPPNTLLRGAGMTLSQLYWPDEDNPKDPLISGTHHFGIEEIFLAAGNFELGIIAKTPGPNDDWRNEHILLRKVRVRFLHTDTTSKEESLRRSQGGRDVYLHGEFIRVIDCDIYSTKGTTSLSGDYSVFRNIRSQARKASHVGGRYSVFEDNNFVGRGISFGNSARCFYLHGNQMGGIYNDGDRETFTFDGGRPTFAGHAQAFTAQSVTLPEGTWRDGAETWIGKSVMVMAGPGAGQHRYIAAIDGRTATLETPWGIVPDDSSYVVVAHGRNRLLFLDNHVYDGNPFQLYGSATDVVLANNICERNSGLHAYGMTKGSTPEPSWFIQFIGNEVREGNAVRGPWSFMVPAADGYIAFFDRGVRKPLDFPQSRVGVIRRNILKANSFVYAGPKVSNMLVENNHVVDSDHGVVVKSKGAVVRGNTFENVILPHDVTDDAVLSPAERFASAMAAAAVALEMPARWDALVAEAAALAREGRGDAEATAACADILQRALPILSATAGDDRIPSTLVASLFGLDLAQPSPWMLNRIASATQTQGQYPVGARYAPWAPPATLSGEASDLGAGWTVKVLTPASLSAGKSLTAKLDIERPDGESTPLTIGVDYTLSGEGWALRFAETYAWRDLTVQTFLVAGPFQNSSGLPIDSQVHPPEINLDISQQYETADGKRGWVIPGQDDKGNVDLTTVFERTEVTTAHAVAVVRAATSLRVEVEFGSHFSTLCMVNGERVGSSSRRPGPAVVTLREGDNLFHIISSHGSGKWTLPLKLKTLDPVMPGELRVLSVDELKASPLLRPSDADAPAGKDLPNSGGIDWELVHRDDFNRLRLGRSWTGEGPSWMTQDIIITDGEMTSAAGWSYMTLHTPIAPPVRIEFDMVYERPFVGIMLFPDGLARHKLWGQLQGRGYMFTLGWHDARNHRLLRDTETVLLNETAPDLVDDKRYHVTVQFVPPMCELYLDGKLLMRYEDPDFQQGLDRIGVSHMGKSTFDNIRVYTQKK